MSEEQACLVRPRSDSETSSKLGSFGSITRAMAYTENRTSAPTEGSGEPANAAQLNNQQPLENNVLDSNESGELIDYNESGALAQFHEDALRQAGCGIYQLRVLLATGLAVMGSSLELSAIPFILPSAEIEMCILPHEKSWLVTITMFGLWAGGFGWGALAERGGRRRALVSALAVNSVFATIAAFMPTYGTAMMARFCSAIGSGGIIPTVYSYMGEFSPRAHRNKALAPLVLFMAMGGLYASGVARALLPYTGPETMKENKQHFSAWHRYLLLCTLPILAALVCLIWTQESPRYLLEVGREHDACSIYQNIHSSNKIVICGNKMADINAGADCRLGELSLPSKRRAVPVHRLRHSLKMFWQAFFQLFSSTYRTQTFTLGGILLLALSLQFYLSAYIPTTVLRMENEQFDLAKRIIQNDTFENQIYNRTIENIEYTNSSFVNCTFRDMFMSHVTFRNCTFLDVTFSNIKTSYTSFKGALFVNSSIIDTDITPERDMDDGCVLNGTTVRGMNGGCGRRADLTSQIYGVCREQTAVASATAAAALAALAPSRFRPPFALSSACVLLSPALHWATSETSLYTIEAVFRFFITLLLYGSCVAVVQSYPASLRCTAHGLLMSVAYMGALVARSVGSLGGGTTVPALVAAAMSVACAAVATRTTNTDNYHM